jgi:hypothetical protein
MHRLRWVEAVQAVAEAVLAATAWAQAQAVRPPVVPAPAAVAARYLCAKSMPDFVSGCLCPQRVSQPPGTACNTCSATVCWQQVKKESKPSKSKVVVKYARCGKSVKNPRCTCVICNKALEQQVCLRLVHCCSLGSS